MKILVTGGAGFIGSAVVRELISNTGHSVRPGHDRRYAMATSKIERELGWKPQESFETELHKTVQWYLDNTEWWQRVMDGTYTGQKLGVLGDADRMERG